MAYISAAVLTAIGAVLVVIMMLGAKKREKAQAAAGA